LQRGSFVDELIQRSFETVSLRSFETVSLHSFARLDRDCVDSATPPKRPLHAHVCDSPCILQSYRIA
jgi:hypothetical protein